MPGQETDPRRERPPFMAADLSPVDSRTELCERFGMRRHTGDTGVRRDTEPGLAGLQEQRRAPHRGPHRLSAEVETVRLPATRAHRPGGPRQLRPDLARRRPDLALPAPSPAGERFQREGVRHTRTRRRGHRHPGATPRQAEAPHAVWPAAFTGQFRTGDGRSCDPLPVADADRRGLFRGSARLSTPPGEARPICAHLVQDDGRPEALRTDHGPPFATPACGGLRTRAVGWSTRGIRHQRLEPGRPAQHGAHERRHRTLNADTTRPPEPHQAAPHARVERCGREDNDARPPAALHDSTPAARDRPSPRVRPAPLPTPTDPGHDVGRRGSHAAPVRFQTRQLCMSETLRQEDSAVEDTAAGIWSIDVDDVRRARLDERDFKRYV